MSQKEKFDMEAVNTKLDQTLIEFFETLGELYKEQANLENIMKNGYLMMSRARYSMGAKSVGISQYDENNMRASKVVIISETESVNKMFEIVSTDAYSSEGFDNPDLLKESSGLRQRKTGGDDKIENIGSENTDQTTDDNRKVKNSKGSSNPIRWFGVLAPQTLRQSQSYFKQATDSVVNISNLKSKVIHLKEQYKSLKKEKKLLSC